MNTTKRIASAMRPHSTLNAPETNNATWFDYNENTDGYFMSSSDWYRTTRYLYFQHLAEINRGRKRGVSYWNDPYITYQSNRDLIEAIADQLDLLPRQRDQAKAWFTDFDLNEWGMRVELVACCLCSRIVHEDEDDERRTHPSVPDDKKPKDFVGIADRFNLREKDVRSMYGKIDSYLRRNTRPISRRFDQLDLDRGDSCREVPTGDEVR